MPKNVVITPLSGLVDFYDLAGNLDAKIQISDAGDLSIGNTGGVLSLGNTASNVFIGDGVNSVDVIFEQNGAIRALTGKTLTLGNSASSVAIQSPLTINSPLLNTTTDGNFEIRQTVPGWTNSTSHPIIKWSYNATYDDNLYLSSGGNQSTTTQTALVVTELGGVIIGAGPSAPNSSSVVSTEWFRLDNSRFTITRNSTQSLTFENSDTTQNPNIISYSAPANAKNIIFDSKTDAANTAVSAGFLGYEFRVAGTSALTIATDRTTSFSNHVTPTGTNLYTLGSASLLWNNVYATTFTGALTGAASSNVLKAGDTMTGALTTNIGAGAASTTKHIDLTNGTYGLFMLPRASAGAYNALTQVGDAVISFTAGTQDTGALVIGPWSASSKGIRIDSSGNVGIGLSSPGAKLDISAGTLGTTLNSQLIISRLTSTASGNVSNIEISAVRDSAGTDWTTAGSRFQQKIDSTWMGWIQFNGTGNQQGISFGTGSSTVNALGVVERLRIDISGNTTPGTTNTQTLGSASLLWGNVYATTFTGALSGNASGSAATFTSTTQNSQFNSVGVGVAASTTAGQLNAGNIIASGIVTGTGGIRSSDTGFPTYQILLDFGSDTVGTWRKIITATLSAGTQYSTHGFKIRITDPNTNHATQGSVNVDEVVYYVACVRTEATVIDTPDLCVVRGPASHVRAVKIATGSYEIQVQPEGQYREYLITIESYATNGAHTIVYSNGSTAGSAGTATYSAAVGGAITWVDKLQSTGTVTGTQLVSNIATGTAPLTVASTTLVTNLNADLLDGLNSATANTVSTIVARDASGNFSAGTITAALTGNASTATTLATARSINGTSFNGSADITVGRLYDTSYRRITNPGGAEYVTLTATITGAIAVTLPVGMSDSMVRMTITVYEYTTNESFEITCGGYNYAPGTTWANNPFAYIVGNPSIDRRFTVRFGYDSVALKAIIYIGELASTWSYPQVYVTDVQVGYSGNSVTWTSGWTIGFEATAFKTVTATITNSQVGYAVSTNTANSAVLRDGSGNFSAGTITAALTGNASTVTNGVYTTDQVVTSRSTAVSTNTGDWNSQVTAGSYQVSGNGTWTGSTNGPSAGYPYGQLLVYVNGNIITQYYYAHATSGNFSRTKFNASDWTVWQEVWTDQNLTNLNQLTNGPGYTSNTGTVTGVTGTAPVVSSGGTAPAISMAAATATVDGYMTAAFASKLDGIAAGAQVNVATNIAQGTRTTTTVPITSSTGTGATLNVATTLLAGVMSSADKTKLDGIATGATAFNPASPGAIGGTTPSTGAFTTITATGNITAYSSDSRLKTNVVAIPNALQKIQQIGGYSFDWDLEKCLQVGFTPEQQHEHGVLAQEIQQVLPDVVVEAAFDKDYLTVRYDRIVPLLIEAIKEQQTIIDSQEQRINRLEEMLNRLIKE